MVLALLCLAGGCQLKPPASVPPQAVYVDPARYVAFHSASAQLRSLDAEISRVSATSSDLPVSDPKLTPPPAPVPAASAVVPEPDPADREIPRGRVAGEVRGDYAVRRKALLEPLPLPAPPAPLFLPDTPAPPDGPRPVRPPAKTQPEISTGLEPKISELNRQLQQLTERPNDRLLYSASQLRRRRELFRQTQDELAELRRKHIQLLQEVLEPLGPQLSADPTYGRPKPSKRRLAPLPDAKPAPMPPPRAPKRELADQEAAALAQVEQLPPLPEPELALAGTPALPELPPADGTMAARVRKANTAPAAGPTAREDRVGRLAVLRRERAECYGLILRDLRAAAQSAGYAQGVKVVFSRGAAPDYTERLAPAVRELVSLPAQALVKSEK